MGVIQPIRALSLYLQIVTPDDRNEQFNKQMNLCGAVHAFIQRLPSQVTATLAPTTMALLCKVCVCPFSFVRAHECEAVSG